MRETKNLYPIKRSGFYIYKRPDRSERYFAQRKYTSGYVKSALLYSLEDAIMWIDTLSDDMFKLPHRMHPPAESSP
jgi:hypothetical protein